MGYFLLWNEGNVLWTLFSLILPCHLSSHHATVICRCYSLMGCCLRSDHLSLPKGKKRESLISPTKYKSFTVQKGSCKKGNYFYPVGTLMQQLPISEARQEQTTCELQLKNIPTSAPVRGQLCFRLVLRHHNQQHAPVLKRPGLMRSCTFPKALHLLSGYYSI